MDSQKFKRKKQNLGKNKTDFIALYIVFHHLVSVFVIQTS